MRKGLQVNRCLIFNDFIENYLRYTESQNEKNIKISKYRHRKPQQWEGAGIKKFILWYKKFYN